MACAFPGKPKKDKGAVKVKIVFLGTGTSVGIPAIGCSCEVCRSPDPLNKRRRASIYLVADNKHIIIDTPPDFREQVLLYKVPRLDAVIYTHSHVDHIIGFDDIRRFNHVQNEIIPVYGPKETLDDLIRIFPYIRENAEPGLLYPRINPVPVENEFQIGRLRVTPISVRHADLPTFGYRLELEGRAMAYIPDCQELSEAAFKLLEKLDLVILDTLRRRFHPTHFNLSQSLEVLQRIKANQAYLTHICHELEHHQTNAELPAGIRLAHDGLIVELK
jgi:phosphoribosyl 1,2-cyclic phosphate phosphodiesterase